MIVIIIAMCIFLQLIYANLIPFLFIKFCIFYDYLKTSPQNNPWLPLSFITYSNNTFYLSGNRKMEATINRKRCNCVCNGGKN